MSFYQSALDFFGDKWQETFDWHTEHGYVYISPEMFAMAVRSDKEYLEGKKNTLDISDTWYIQYVAGDLTKLFEMIPYKLEWISFERENSEGRRFYKYDTLKRIIGANHGKSKDTSGTESTSATSRSYCWSASGRSRT